MRWRRIREAHGRTVGVTMTAIVSAKPAAGTTGGRGYLVTITRLTGTHTERSTT